jgi:hypothetical protein
VRIRVENPNLLSDLCQYLTRDGCLSSPLGPSQADVAVPGAASEWEVAQTLMMEIRLWQARHETTLVTLG